MALPLLKVCSTDGHTRNGTTCLLLITMSECAFLIWKLRCKRLLDIQPGEPASTLSPQEAHHQMLATINGRLNQDKILTSRKRYSVGRIIIHYRTRLLSPVQRAR